MTATTSPKTFKAFGTRDEKDVLSVIRDPASDIRFIRLIFPDILGRQMDFTIPASELAAAFKEGKGFDGSSIAGFVRIEESDLVIKPDPRTFRVLPWTYEGFDPDIRWREAVMFGDILMPDGTVYAGDSRAALKRVLARTRKELGVEDLKCGPELEFFIFPSSEAPEPTDAGGYFFSGRHGEVRKEIQLLLHRMGVTTEYDHHETAPSQHEIDLRYLEAVEAADTAMIFRYMVKKVCRMHGLYATFMPKPVNGQNGSGMHVHQSLWRGGRNLFFEKNGPYHLSLLAQRYMAGLMTHAREISAVLSQWVNSYKRLIEGYEAPVYVAWGQRNRSAYIRVPEYQPGKEQATRIELRAADPACNIYLTFAVMLAAGAEGIRKKYELVDPVEENIYRMSGARQRKFDIRLLPRDLEEAVRVMEKSAVVKDALGDHIFAKLVANKLKEVEEYGRNVSGEFDKQVSDFEIRRYLPIL
ncbi:MAG TPA: glutamine synthetase family protein [Candidatus Aminicenantes bacterium]|nr:glutamine synthetase family protein [Candidatus Aminicenantes bacterium]HRY64714.1 glutamine synthetase family protein [Candidatus Aminicenantes bacterium]HRZ71627.1 glutamine synthetase family protein [Candidatus Aminicenantes bacterium]